MFFKFPKRCVSDDIIKSERKNKKVKGIIGKKRGIKNAKVLQNLNLFLFITSLWQL